ncbi:alpha/beta hydrolase [Mycobacterium shottsii]|uniref:alpha/beta hydrolase n=1 Tax=Mycobacterium shottsii TaxID=133549 RepID=UPI001E48C5A6|nr:alpha/beta fold hydrolase [Mycobacterium shottsii]
MARRGTRRFEISPGACADGSRPPRRTPVQRRPATAADLVDWAERYLDEQGLQRPHLVGHSMGGYLAIELARRGRAATVCVFAPGGFWASGDGLRERTLSRALGGAGIARLMRGSCSRMARATAIG